MYIDKMHKNGKYAMRVIEKRKKYIQSKQFPTCVFLRLFYNDIRDIIKDNIYLHQTLPTTKQNFGSSWGANIISW